MKPGEVVQLDARPSLSLNAFCVISSSGDVSLAESGASTLRSAIPVAGARALAASWTA
jgi:hypothetical protein